MCSEIPGHAMVRDFYYSWEYKMIFMLWKGNGEGL